MDCPELPACAAALLDWLRARLGDAEPPAGPTAAPAPRDAAAGRQGLLFRSAPYADDAPAVRTPAELDGALEHLEYAIFRRQRNQLTRAERARLDNTIDNALFKADRYAGRLEGPERAEVEARVAALRESIAAARAAAEQQKHQARRADLKLSQLGSLTPEGFEEFVAELFEALGYSVERCGGTGDEGADLRVFKAGLRGIVQCKYHSRGVVGSPELQKFLGSVHHNQSHKGYFVTTRTFTLAAERFAAEHPIELIDGPRLVELVQEALGPAARREPEPAWF
jgi:restriction system protein